MIRVVCWLWRDESYRWNHLFRYGPDHVNRLASMVRRNLSMPHEFVCVTDDPEGIDPSIRIVPLWDDFRAMGGCYVRLKAFAPEMAEIIGPRFVWIDVDCVVTGDLTPLFDRDDEFVAWGHGLNRTPYCGSMVMMTAGARREVWDRFRENPRAPIEAAKAKGYIGTDQAVMAAVMGRGEATWSRADGVASRYDVLTSKLPGRARRMGCIAGISTEPKDTRIVFFHGPFDPSQKRLQEAYPWIKENWK